MSFIYDKGESGRDVRHEYFWRVAHEALEETRAEYGDYVLKSSRLSRESRRMYVLEHDLGDINFTIAPYQPDLEGKLIMVHIPADRGLMGYRVMMIRRAAQERFDRISTAADLHSLRFGLMESWVAAQVLQSNGLDVVGGSSYEGLFRMLAGSRFDALDRSAAEIVPEYDSHAADLPDIAIEKHVLLHYPMADYFWFTDTKDGRRRAERIELGLRRMVANGALKRIFDERFGPALKRLDLRSRHVVELSNPLADTRPALANPALWYRPEE